LVAFADDLLLIFNDVKEAEDLIKAAESLSGKGLKLNKKKSCILSDQKEVKLLKLTEIAGIEIKSEIKYLGFKFALRKDAFIQNAKNDATKCLSVIKGKIQTQHEPLKKLILGAFFKILLIYFFSPLYAAGIINRNDVFQYEAQLKRKNILFQNDNASAII
jgi:hypothetical protein